MKLLRLSWFFGSGDVRVLYCEDQAFILGSPMIHHHLWLFFLSFRHFQRIKPVMSSWKTDPVFSDMTTTNRFRCIRTEHYCKQSRQGRKIWLMRNIGQGQPVPIPFCCVSQFQTFTLNQDTFWSRHIFIYCFIHQQKLPKGFLLLYLRTTGHIYISFKFWFHSLPFFFNLYIYLLILLLVSSYIHYKHELCSMCLPLMFEVPSEACRIKKKHIRIVFFTCNS